MAGMVALVPRRREERSMLFVANIDDDIRLHDSPPHAGAGPPCSTDS
jgi:hypothetical protein